jgi:hypothetical protein
VIRWSSLRDARARGISFHLSDFGADARRHTKGELP